MFGTVSARFKETPVSKLGCSKSRFLRDVFDSALPAVKKAEINANEGGWQMRKKEGGGKALPPVPAVPIVARNSDAMAAPPLRGEGGEGGGRLVNFAGLRRRPVSHVARRDVRSPLLCDAKSRRSPVPSESFDTSALQNIATVFEIHRRAETSIG